MDYQTQRQEIVELGRSLFARGYAFGTSGNISVKVEGGYLVTPTNMSLGDLHSSTITFLDSEWNYVSGDQPTKEIPMHQAFYESNEHNHAVVHLHSTHATALSCTFSDNTWTLPHLTPYSVMRLGHEIGVVPYVKPGDPQLAQEIRKVARHSTAVLMRNHGIATAGRSLNAAANAAEEFEQAAKIYLLLNVNQHQIDPLTQADVDELARL